MAAKHIAWATRHFNAHPNDPSLPYVIEIDYGRYFAGEDWEPIYAWLRSDHGEGEYTEYWIDQNNSHGQFVAFSHYPTAVAFKMQFG